MVWTYKQTSGELDHDGAEVGAGYSGHGDGLNNPEMQNVRNVGPIPQGTWTIGPPVDPPDHLGPLAMPLTHVSGDEFGRDDFFIHGDNAAGNHSASDCCIIMSRTIRQQIADSDDPDLQVAPRRDKLGRDV